MTANIELPLGPKDLAKATPEQLLACSLGAWGGLKGDDVVSFGLEAAVSDLELLCELAQACERHGEGLALCNVQARLRVLAEMHRRQVEDVTLEASGALGFCKKITEALRDLMDLPTFKPTKEATKHTDQIRSALIDLQTHLEVLGGES